MRSGLELGREGEDAAARVLIAKKFKVVARNWRCTRGEVDLICDDGQTLVFVEVKTRAEGSLGTGADAVNPRKRSRIIRAAAEYLSAKNLWSRPCRFDVVSLVKKDGQLVAEHIPDAFEAQWEKGNSARGWQPW